MYVHPDCSIPTMVRQELTLLEEDIAAPIRVLHGRCRGNFVKPRWEAAHRGEFTAEQARETGITVVHWGSVHNESYRTLTYPGDAGVFTGYNETRGPMNLYDSLRMPDSTDDWLAEPIIIGDWTVGEISDRMILLHTQYLSYDDVNVDEVAKQPILKSMDADFLAGFKERMVTVVRDRFVAYARRSSNLGLDDLRTEVGQLMRDYDTSVRKAATKRVELRQKQKFLDALLDGDGGASVDQMLKTWDMLLADDRIEDVSFDSANRLIIETAGLHLAHPGTGDEVYLGKLKWIIGIEDQFCEVRNLDNARGGYDHPHVYMGNPCFGELGTTVYTLLKQGNIYPAVEMIFAFLKSINIEDDWGRRASFWFDDPMDSPRNAPAEPVQVEELDEVIENVDFDAIEADLEATFA